MVHDQHLATNRYVGPQEFPNSCLDASGIQPLKDVGVWFEVNW